MTNGQFTRARFINSKHHVNKLVMLLMLFRHVAHLAKWNFCHNQVIICVHDLFCKRKQVQGLLYRGTTAWEQKS